MAVARHRRTPAVVAGLDVMALSDDNGIFDSTSGPLTQIMKQTQEKVQRPGVQAVKRTISLGVDGRWAPS